MERIKCSCHASERLTDHFNFYKTIILELEETAKSSLQQYIKIGRDLVKNQVTVDIANVDSVLKNGFYHLYGPGAGFIQRFQEAKR